MLHARLCRMHSDPISLFQDREANPGAEAANRDGKDKLLHQNVAHFRSFLYLCALEFPPAAVLASAILYLGKNQLEIEYEF